MKYIYTRVSTESQTTDGQTHALAQKYPDAQLVSEVASGAKHRPVLKALLANMQPADTLIVAALDRLGRSTIDVLRIVEQLTNQQINLISEREAFDYSTPSGKLVMQILISVAELERALIIQRTKAGLAAARARGRIGGKPRTVSPQQIERAIAEVQAGTLSRTEAAAKHCVGYSYLVQLLRSPSRLERFRARVRFELSEKSPNPD